MLSTASKYDVTEALSEQGAPHAIIIGAGIAGCALALLLKRAGIESTLYEAYTRDQAWQGIGGGLQIASNGMSVLAELGLAHKLSTCGVVGSEFAFHNQHGKLLVAVPLDPHKELDQPAVLMTRAAIHEVLMEAVEQEGIRIEFGKRLADLTGFDEEDDEVTAVFDDGTSARGDLVVGADGVRSHTRSIILGDHDPKPHFVGLMTSGGFVQSDAFVGLPESQQGTIHFLFGPTGGSFGYCRAKGDEPRLVMWWRNMNVEDHPEWAGRAPTKEELQAIDEEELKAQILDIPGGWSPLARQLVADTEHILRGTVHDVNSLPRWFEGRAVLVGDAAHAVSPHAGQGASMALEDAMYLAKTLRLALRDHRAESESRPDGHQQRRPLPRAVLESAFRAFEEGRKERTEAIVAEGRRRGEPRVKKGQQPPGAVKQWATETMLKGIFTFLLPSMIRSVTSYRIEWEDSSESLADFVDRERRRRNSSSWLATFGAVAVLAVGVAMFLHPWAN
jgi:2-polyprenyl-6-methoxyphenol hydroxylase-like FAD-dependent oxidoreductase